MTEAEFLTWINGFAWGCAATYGIVLFGPIVRALLVIWRHRRIAARYVPGAGTNRTGKRTDAR